MEDSNEQIRKLEKAKGILLGERQVIVNKLAESSDFFEDVTLLVKHQEAIEVIDRIIEDERKLGKPGYNLENLV